MTITPSVNATFYDVSRSWSDGSGGTASLIGSVDIALGSYTIMNNGPSPFTNVSLTLIVNGETVLERVMVIARNRSLAVHHVTVHDIGGKLSVSLDLEVDGSLALGVAHDIATELEEAVRDEIGAGVEVETHIEPLQPHDQPGVDAAPERTAAVRAALADIAARIAGVGEVHDVRVRQSDGAEIVNFHCLVDPLLTVATVHERVDDVERALRTRFPSIKRVIGHAEPRRGAG